MNKIYEVKIIKNFLPNGNNFSYQRSWAQEDHITDYWIELGGKIPDPNRLYLEGNNEIMTEFILTYQYVNCLKIIVQ